MRIIKHGGMKEIMCPKCKTQIEVDDRDIRRIKYKNREANISVIDHSMWYTFDQVSVDPYYQCPDCDNDIPVNAPKV